MIITVVCDVLGKENNGTTIAAMNLINSMKARGHEVRVVCADEDKKDLPGFYVVPTLNLGPINSYIAKNGVSLAKADKRVLERAITGADVVHCMLPYSLGAHAAKIAKRLSIPLTGGCHALAENFTTHIFLARCGVVNLLTYKIYYHRLYKHCDYVHYPSQMMCELFEGATAQMPHCIISNGVGETFRPKHEEKPEEYRDQFVILFTGRYSKEKSHQTLIDGVRQSRYRDNIRLIFAGAGPLTDKLKKYADKRLTVKPVFGFFSRAEMRRIINYADLYVHPARYEAEGIACLEAMACGKTILSSDSRKSATHSFALTEKNLFRCNDPESLAKKIDYWIEHPQARTLCGEVYAQYASRFNFEQCMNEMEEMFYDAAGTKSDSLFSDDRRLRGNEYCDEDGRCDVPVHS